MSTSEQNNTGRETVPTQITPNTIESIPEHTIVEATITDRDTISINTHEQTPLAEHISDRKEKHISNGTPDPETTTYSASSFPAELTVSARDLIEHNGVTSIIVTVEKQSTAKSHEEINQQLRQTIIEELLREDEEFRGQYENAQHNPLKRLLSVFFNRNLIPSRTSFEQLPKHLQERVEREINARSLTNDETRTLVRLRDTVSDDETDTDIFNLHMEFSVMDNHVTGVREKLNQNNIDIIEQENEFSTNIVRATTGVPSQLLAELEREH